jgi:hypothetical protein
MATFTYVFAGWNLINKCAYNTSAYPRPSIFKYPHCFDQFTTLEINNAMASVGKYYKYTIDKKFRWDDQESGTIINKRPLLCMYPFVLLTRCNKGKVYAGFILEY